jgi:hypothetical protein
MTIKVKPGRYKKYPYMDTFKRFDPNEGILYNDDDEDESYKGQYILNDTGGGYDEIASGVWSEWHDRRIPHDQAVWSDWADSYLNRDYATYIETGSRGNRDSWYPEDCDDIVYDEWIGEPIHTDDSVYSEAYGYYLYDENAVRTIDEILSDGDVTTGDGWRHKDDDNIIRISSFNNMLWYEKLSGEFSDWIDNDYTHIVVDNLIENYKGEWIPKIIETEIYKVSESDENDSSLGGIEWLTEVDALILGCKLNKEELRVIDKIQYNKDIENLIPKLIKKIAPKLRLWTDKVQGTGQQRLKFEEPEAIKKAEEIMNKKILKDLRDRRDEFDSKEWIYEY